MKTAIKIGAILIILASTISLKAQIGSINTSIKAGGNISNSGGEEIESNSKIGFKAGVTLEYQIADFFYFQSGINADVRNIQYAYTIAETQLSTSTEAQPIYLQAPVHIVTKVPVGFETNLVIHIGGYLASGIGGKEKTSIVNNADMTETKVDGNYFNNERSKLDYGVGLAVGLEISKIVFDFGYDQGLANINRNKNIPALRNRNAYLTIGYIF